MREPMPRRDCTSVRLHVPARFRIPLRAWHSDIAAKGVLYGIQVGFVATVVSCTRFFNRAARSWMKWYAEPASRVPTNQQGTSLVSAQRAVHVHTSPAVPLFPSGAFTRMTIFRRIGYCGMAALKALSWYCEQTRPASMRNLVIAPNDPTDTRRSAEAVSVGSAVFAPDQIWLICSS
jgi:hypothetical protein